MDCEEQRFKVYFFFYSFRCCLKAGSVRTCTHQFFLQGWPVPTWRRMSYAFKWPCSDSTQAYFSKDQFSFGSVKVSLLKCNTFLNKKFSKQNNKNLPFFGHHATCPETYSYAWLGSRLEGFSCLHQPCDPHHLCAWLHLHSLMWQNYNIAAAWRETITAYDEFLKPPESINIWSVQQ